VVLGIDQGTFNDAMVALNGAQFVALIAIGLYLSRLTERIGRIEENIKWLTKEVNGGSSDKR